MYSTHTAVKIVHLSQYEIALTSQVIVQFYLFLSYIVSSNACGRLAFLPGRDVFSSIVCICSWVKATL